MTHQNESARFIARSFEYFQKVVRQTGPAASASYTMIGAIILLGGLGYFLDKTYGWSPYGLLFGLLLGIVVGFYELIKVIWSSN